MNEIASLGHKDLLTKEEINKYFEQAIRDTEQIITDAYAIAVDASGEQREKVTHLQSDFLEIIKNHFDEFFKAINEADRGASNEAVAVLRLQIKAVVSRREEDIFLGEQRATRQSYLEESKKMADDFLRDALSQFKNSVDATLNIKQPTANKRSGWRRLLGKFLK